jgi:hypothetical protein
VLSNLLSYDNQLPADLKGRGAAKAQLQQAACDVLVSLVTNASEETVMAAAVYCLEPLQQLPQRPENLQLKEQAVSAVFELVKSHEPVQELALAAPGLLADLVQQLLISGYGLLHMHAAAALAALSRRQDSRAAVAAAGGIWALVLALKKSTKKRDEVSCNLRLSVTSALWQFAMDRSSSSNCSGIVASTNADTPPTEDSSSSNSSYLAALAEHGCMLPVVSVIQQCVITSDISAALPACGIISELAADDGYRAAIISAGGIPAVAELLQFLTETPASPSSSSSSDDDGDNDGVPGQQHCTCN